MKEDEIVGFHDDLRAAVFAGIPLSLHDSRVLSIEDVSHLQTRLSALQTNGNFTIPATGDFPERYRAALEIFAKTGAMHLVLDGLSVDGRAKEQIKRSLGWTMTYLFVLLVAACAGLIWISATAVPMVEQLRSDLLQQVLQQLPLQQERGLSFTTWAVIAICTVFIIFLIWTLSGGTLRLAMWLGGSRFEKATKCMEALTIAQTVEAAGIESDHALNLGFDIVGLSSVDRQELRAALSNPSKDASTKPPTLDATVWNGMAEYFSVVAAERINRLRVLAPIILVVGLGGSVTALYCIAIFRPVVGLLRDIVHVTGGA